LALYISHQWSWVHTQYRIHQVQHTPSTAYPEYCIHRILHHPKINCLPLPASLISFIRPCCNQFSIFLQLWVNQWIESKLPSCLLPELAPLEWPPPNTHPMSLHYGLQVHHQTLSIIVSKCISTDARLRIPSWHDHGLQVRLQPRSLTATKFISKLARLQPSSISPNTLDYGLQVRTITASQCISKLTRS